MSFSEKSTLRGERRPLLRDSVWHSNHRYGREMERIDEEELDELLGLDSPRNRRFQWIVFLTITFLSIILLLATMGVLIRLSQVNPLNTPPPPAATTTQIPFKVSSPLPTSSSSPSASPTPPNSIETSSTVAETDLENATSLNVNSSAILQKI